MRSCSSPSFITKTACRECREGRAKCDEKVPCGGCASKGGLNCEYDASVHIRKEDMRQEINNLREYRQNSEKILGLLATGSQSDLIVRKLQQNELLQDIIEQLGGYSPNIKGVQSGLSSHRRESFTFSGRTGADGYVSPCIDETDVYHFKNGSRWTELPFGDSVIEHLLLLYFCWEYPIFSNFSKRHFARDFNTGRNKYCSPLLVNSILAVGCRFSDQVEARTVTDDLETAGEHCYLEAERLLVIFRGERTVTVIQSMGLMSTWLASRGDYRKARFYAAQALRMAVEIGLHPENASNDIFDDTCEVYNATYWGAIMLDQAWSLVTGCLPQISRDGIAIEESAIFDRDELREWIPYAGKQVPQSLDLRQLSSVHGVYKSLCKLSTIIHTTLYVMYGATDSLTARDMLDQYSRMLDWYSSLPEGLQLGKNSTPSVLFVHMYYHFSIILSFYPLRGVQFADSTIFASEIYTNAADAIVALCRSYKSLHGLRRTPCFLPYIIFASGIAHIGTNDPQLNSVDALTRSAQEVAISQLMSLYHGSSKSACRILISRSLHFSSTGASLDQDSDGEGCRPWEPFVATMTKSRDDTRSYSPSMSNFTRMGVPDSASHSPEEYLRRSGPGSAI